MNLTTDDPKMLDRIYALITSKKSGLKVVLTTIDTQKRAFLFDESTETQVEVTDIEDTIHLLESYRDSTESQKRD